MSHQFLHDKGIDAEIAQQGRKRSAGIMRAQIKTSLLEERMETAIKAIDALL